MALRPLSDSIQQAFLYGSTARGTERAESDIDLMVIGDVLFFDVISAVSPLQETLGREINPTVFTSDEFEKRLAARDHFVRSGSAVKSEDYANAYFVAAKVYGPGIEDGTGPGVWFTTGDKDSPGLVFSVNSYARVQRFRPRRQN